MKNKIRIFNKLKIHTVYTNFLGVQIINTEEKKLVVQLSI